MFQTGISFNLTPKTPNTNRDEVTKISEKTRTKLVAIENQKLQQFAIQEAEEKALLDRINQEMVNQENESKPVQIGEEMDIAEDLTSALIAVRKCDDENELDSIKELLRKSPNNKDIVIDKFNIDITVSKLVCLRPNTWLNDEVVNFYMCMLQERDQNLCRESNGTRTPSHYFNSFFMSKLMENGQYTYGNVKRWSKKFDVFAMDRIFMPINLNNSHWVMSVAYVQRREIHYYDSMTGNGERHLKAILRWLGDESQDKKKCPLDTHGWRLVDGQHDVPQQNNGYDCGVFSIICADFLSDGLPLEYSQSEMSTNRLRIAAAIKRGSLKY